MDIAANFRVLALYNQRMNQQLIKVCETLSNEELHQDRGAFFTSIMAHWNHILFGDLIMLQRLVANQCVDVGEDKLANLPTSKSIHDTFVKDIEHLKSLRSTVDDIYIDVTRQLTHESCQRLVRYTTTEGILMERTVAQFCQHIFNHQTHHRGQLTCLLSQIGVDFGCTDLPMIVRETVL
ncbi:DinB family protein [Vibrio maritimus]|jgi:uncharacterized damage-inducible protein DinB